MRSSISVAGLLAGALVFTPGAAIEASGLRVETGSIVPNAASGVARVTTRITWSNAWRNARNHDAVWVVVKVRRQPAGAWRHARLSAARVDSSSPRVACEVSADRIGAFCSAAGIHRGDVASTVSFDIDLSALPQAERAAALDAHAVGIEMVFIPGGPFSVGDPDPRSAEQAALYRSDAAGKHAGPFRVASEAPIPIAGSEGSLFYLSANEYQGDRSGPLPADFPKGTRPFFAMKYEVLQGQYAEFLNMISPEMAGFRANISSPRYYDNRGTIRVVNGRYSTDRPARPANMLSWDDGTAFADWAGLRPMTELEFTKAARGPVEPIAGDYPWGTSSKTRLARLMEAAGDLTQAGAADESRLTDETKDVLGASHWWVMDLAGSVWEKVVSVGHPAGRSFRGTHGDGELRGYGLATNTDWPSGDQDGGGYGYRGGGHYEWARERARDLAVQEFNPHSPVEWRPYGAWGGAPRSVAYGFRAVRTSGALPAASTPGQQPSEREAVRRAALDYLEGFYEGDTAKLVRSVRPEVFKIGFGRNRDSTQYGPPGRMTWPQFLGYARNVKASNNPAPATAPKGVELLDVLDQTANVKVTAWWGTDYLLMAKFDGRWMITHVLWQSSPP